MARPAVFTWPVPDPDGIANLQTTAGAGSLTLNGELVNTGGTVIFNGISRAVTLTSAGNVSGVNFTINGTLAPNGAVSETIAGPNANTVETTQVFDTITSITVNGAVGTNTSAGSGTLGFTHWFNHNYHATVVGFSVQVNVTGTINYDYQTTLDDVNIDATPVAFEPITGTAVGHLGFPADMVSATADQLAFCQGVTRYSRIQINSSGADGQLVATFLQQGIT